MTPSYVAPNAHAIAIAVATMEAHADFSLRDRYLGDVREKTGCSLHVRIAHLPVGKNLDTRATAAERLETTKQERNPDVDRVAAIHVQPTAPLSVTLENGETVVVGMVSVVVATETCADPASPEPEQSPPMGFA